MELDIRNLTTAVLEPGPITSDSVKTMPPGMFTSYRWSFRNFVMSLPWGSQTVSVL